MSNPNLSPALRGIQESALAIFDQRKRLNDAFAALQTAAKAIEPHATLHDDGRISLNGNGPDVFVPTPARETVERQVAHDRRAAQEARAKVTPAPPEPSPAPLGDAARGIKPEPISTKRADEARADAIVAYIQGLGVAVGFNNIKEYTGSSDDAVKRALRIACDGGKIAKTPTNLYRSTTEKERTEKESPPEEPKRTLRHNKAPDSSQAVPQNDDGTFGMSHGPDRATMRSPQVATEQRYDKIVYWAINRPGDTFDSLTLHHEMPELHRDSAQAADDVRTLMRRGVFERTGRSVHPPYKLNNPEFAGNGKKGRTTPEYRIPKA